ncbi:MAG: sulfotransferase [Actinomycetia bacterium]|nr:sulfotransferase [Actinomycetes bacterium]
MAPVVIGGVAGSGTRAYRAVAVEAGVEMLGAPWLVRALKGRDEVWYHDNLLLRRFYYSWAIKGLRDDDTPRHEVLEALALKSMLVATGPFRRRGRWGWKNPLTLLSLPIIARSFPDAYFIHVVRDGRDVALGGPHTLLERLFLLTEEQQEDPFEVQRGHYWSVANQKGAAEAQELFGDRYLLSRWEDLMSDPESEVRRIHAFLGVDDDLARGRAVAQISPQPSQGRWREFPAEQVASVQEACQPLLGELGYSLT